MKRKDVINIILFILVFAFAAYRYSVRTYTSQRSAFIMDTIVDLKIETKHKNTNELLCFSNIGCKSFSYPLCGFLHIYSRELPGSSNNCSNWNCK